MLALRMTYPARRALTSSAATLFAVLGAATTADAHFVLQAPTNWVTINTSDGSPQKTAPCGNEGARLANGTASGPSRVVNQLVPNADGTSTVTLTVDEVVPHAGWYRVSLVSGLSSTQTTSTLPDPMTPATSCAATIVNPPVLPVVADGILMHQQFSGPQTVMVTIPANVSCTSAAPCTLQVVEVMNDGGHFPPGCFYHHCADIAIGNSDGGASTTVDSGATTANQDSGATGTGGAAGTGGVAGAGGNAGGGAGSSATGGSAAPVADGDSGGCAISPSGRGRAGIAGLGVLLAAAALLRRRMR